MPPVPKRAPDNTTLILGECIEEMWKLPKASIDLIVADLPYGVTQNHWDSIIPLNWLWEAYRRVRKPRTAIVLTAIQPFTTKLVASNYKEFHHSWVWLKDPVGFLNAKKQPMRAHEDVLVFCDSSPRYFPQGLQIKAGRHNRGSGSKNYGGYEGISEQFYRNYPSTILRFNPVRRAAVHTTQKPTSLLEYLIKTFSKEGDTVLDNTMGSGSTGVACCACNRKFIGIEKDPEIYKLAVKRIKEYQARATST